MTQPRVRRLAAKVLLVDERGRVLLFQGVDLAAPDKPQWWFAVGGGVEMGEDLPAAAIREVREETGLRIPWPGPVVMTRRFSWTFEGTHYDQEDAFFVVRTAAFAPRSDGWSAMERATIRNQRWWSIEELRATTDVVYPDNLPDVLERLLA